VVVVVVVGVVVVVVVVVVVELMTTALVMYFLSVMQTGVKPTQVKTQLVMVELLSCVT
jgi:hypothetical protein